MDDYNFEKLSKENKVFAIIATAGEGAFPKNSINFWKSLSDTSLPSDHLKNVEYAVFGLGDSSYK